MVEFTLNNVATNTGVTQQGSTNFDSLLNLARGQLDNISKEVQNLLTQTPIKPGSALLDAAGVKIQVPQLSNLITGQTDILLKVATPLDKTQPAQVQVNNSNVVLVQNRPVLQLQGLILQNNVTPQRFSAEIPLQSLATQNPQTAQAISNLTNQSSDQVVRNFLPNQQVQAFTNNLAENIRPLLPQNLQNLNLNSQQNLNLQINNFTTPSGQQINLDPNAQAPATQQNIQPTNINPQTATPITQTNPTAQSTQTSLPQTITGQVEIFPDANEALIRTDFGTFRVNNLTQLPNGSQVNFTIQGQAISTPTQESQNLLNLNPTSVQALKLSLESADSPIQNLLRTLNSAQVLTSVAQRLFPHPDDKTAYARQLFFLSGATKGSPEGWLGDDGQMIINSTPESDGNLNRLNQVFNSMQSFTGHGDKPISTEWNSYVIPFFDGNKLSFVTVQVQRDPEGENSRTTKGKRKFVLELEQNDLGRVTIEGLYSKVEGKVNNLDIILKTDNPVSPEFAAELSAIFTDTATAYGFAGSIDFTGFTTSTPAYTDISKILGDGIVI